jgi:hypothetical protein
VSTVNITLVPVDGPVLKLTRVVVLSVMGALLVVVARKSDLIYPTEPPTLTVDHPDGLCSSISTPVPGARVVILLALVDGPVLKLTLVVVWNASAAKAV